MAQLKFPSFLQWSHVSPPVGIKKISCHGEAVWGAGLGSEFGTSRVSAFKPGPAIYCCVTWEKLPYFAMYNVHFSAQTFEGKGCTL